MAKKYNIQENSTFKVGEAPIEYSPSIGIVDALWTLISNQTQEVQQVLLERLDSFCARNKKESIKKTRLDAFKKLTLEKRPAELDDKTILAECKAARQEIYRNITKK